MPQWRKLHAKTVDSLDINDMPDDFTRLLWVLLTLTLDREGRGLDNPAWVKSRAMPLREDVSCKQVAAALDWFARRGMIVRYEVGGRRYFCVPTWRAHQGDTSRETASVFPAPEDATTHDQLTRNSRPAQDLLTTNSCPDADADADADAEEIHPANAGADAPPPVVASKPKTQRTKAAKKPPTPSQEMFTALAKACSIDLAMITPGQRGALNQTERMLREAGIKPEQIAAFREWWNREDWRGKRGDAPEPHQVREEWGRYLDGSKPAPKSPASVAVRVYE